MELKVLANFAWLCDNGECKNTSPTCYVYKFSRQTLLAYRLEKYCLLVYLDFIE